MAEERLQRPADGDRTAPTVDRVGEGDADHDVDRPRLHTPVQVGLGERALRQLRVGAGDAGTRCDVVAERLAHAVEDETDAHPRREQQREPGSQENSGSSSSLPSLMSPKRLKPRTSANATKNAAIRT
jgi:hypothetical protein